MRRSKLNTKLVGLGGLSIVIITGVGVVLFVPLSVLGFVDEISIEDALNKAKNNAEGVGFEIPVCDEIINCTDNYEIENKTLIDEIIDPETEGIQEIIPEVIINEDDKEIIVEEGIEQPTTEIIQDIIPEKEPPIVEIISNITKIDNAGERFTSLTNFNSPLFGLFVEDTTNKNFDQGFIENQLIIKTDPNSNIELNGFFDILINNKTILTNPIMINAQGITDQDGMISIDFLSPTGIPSDVFLFQFNDHLDKFPEQGITDIKYSLSSVTITINEFSYSLNSQTILTMDIFTDQNIILITNEEGEIVRVLPTDDTLKISSSARNWTYKNGRGCKALFGKQTCGSYITVKAGIRAPVMGSGEVFHITKTGQVESIATYPATSKGGCTNTNRGTSCGSITKLNIIIQRDEIYKIVFKNPNGEVMFKTPVTKTTYSFYCKELSNAPTSSNIFCNYNDPTTKDTLLATLEQPWLNSN